MRPMPPVELIRRSLSYDPITGIFVRIVHTGIGKNWVGKEAGCVSVLGYRKIGITGYGQFQAHRLAWVHIHGSIPNDMEIDHIDGNPRNNALTNLRLATSSQQKMNRGVQTNSQSGLKGAYYHAIHKGKKWRSQIKVGPKLIFLGYYHTPDEAHQAYVKACLEYHGEFARVA